jgi:hypothetical protein
MAHNVVTDRCEEVGKNIVEAPYLVVEITKRTTEKEWIELEMVSS